AVRQDVAMGEAAKHWMHGVVGKDLGLNVSAAIPAVLLGVGFALQALKGVPILARAAGLIAHLTDEQEAPIGFALSYQATRQVQYQGEVPPGFGQAQP